MKEVEHTEEAEVIQVDFVTGQRVEDQVEQQPTPPTRKEQVAEWLSKQDLSGSERGLRTHGLRIKPTYTKDGPRKPDGAA